MELFKISIVTPTYNRPDELKRLLRSIAEQDYPHDRFECILVDDGSTVDLGDVLSEFAHGSIHISYSKTSHRGVAAARNQALNSITGDIVLFTDDDCVLDRSVLSKLNRAYQNETVDGVYGSVRGFENNWFSKYGSRTYFNRRWEKYTMNNVSFRRSVLECSRFDEKRQTFEDVDFVEKTESVIHAKNHQLVKADTLVYHRSYMNVREFMAPSVRAGRWYLAFYSPFNRGFMKSLYICLFPVSFLTVFISKYLLLGFVSMFMALMLFHFLANSDHRFPDFLFLPFFAFLACCGFFWGIIQYGYDNRFKTS